MNISRLSDRIKSQITTTNNSNTPGTAGGPGGRDQTLAVKRRKNAQLFCMYLLVMPKYWRKQIFTHGRFPEVGQKQKTEKKNKKRRKKQKLPKKNIFFSYAKILEETNFRTREFPLSGSKVEDGEKRKKKTERW